MAHCRRHHRRRRWQRHWHCRRKLEGADHAAEVYECRRLRTTKDAIEAINYVIDRKKAGVNVRVISASWGSTQRSRALEEVIRKAYEADILFVAASGNANTNNDRTPHYPSSYNVPNVISVAALDRNDQLASFSNYGPKSVAIAAPGVDILSTWLGDEYEEKSGTSMATPVVAGVAALIAANEPKITVDDLRARLLGAVDPLNTLKGKVASAGGLTRRRLRIVMNDE